MEQKVIKKIVWSFVKNEQPEKALKAALELRRGKKFNKFLARITDYYLEQIVLPKRFIWRQRKKLSDLEWCHVFECLASAYEIAEKIELYNQRQKTRKKILEKGIKCLKKSEGSSGYPTEELAGVLYNITHHLIKTGLNDKRDSYLRRLVKNYLKITHLRGKEILKIVNLMTVAEGYEEAKRLVPIFIKRGDYEALKLLGGTYGKLEEKIISESEKIVLSCLEKGKIKEAEEALSLITDANKRQEYCELLSVDFKPAEK